jgi:hypothetical protein
VGGSLKFKQPTHTLLRDSKTLETLKLRYRNHLEIRWPQFAFFLAGTDQRGSCVSWTASGFTAVLVAFCEAMGVLSVAIITGTIGTPGI